MAEIDPVSFFFADEFLELFERDSFVELGVFDVELGHEEGVFDGFSAETGAKNGGGENRIGREVREELGFLEF